MPPEAFVILRGGLTLPAEPIRLMLALEARVIWVEVDGEDLVVGPPERLPSANGAPAAHRTGPCPADRGRPGAARTAAWMERRDAHLLFERLAALVLLL